MVAGAVSVPGLSPGSGSEVRVVVVVIGIVVRGLVWVIRIVSDHHVIPSDRGRVSVASGGTLLLARHGAQLRSAAGGGDPRGAPGLGGGRVVTAADDHHRVTAVW